MKTILPRLLLLSLLLPVAKLAADAPPDLPKRARPRAQQLTQATQTPNNSATPSPQKATRPKKKAADFRITPNPSLPNVLLLGDSISIGYTLPVRKLLAGKANVFRPVQNNGAAENCSGSGKGVDELDRWLALQTKWDVIHFNWGLHDLKHVTKSPSGFTNSSDPNTPVLHDPEEYRANLERIVDRLHQTGARLIFATTTPVVPGTTNPLRSPDAPARYNAVAMELMKTNRIRVNDLFSAIQPRLADLQLPKNVHFTPQGYEFLAQQVADAIEAELKTSSQSN